MTALETVKAALAVADAATPEYVVVPSVEQRQVIQRIAREYAGAADVLRGCSNPEETQMFTKGTLESAERYDALLSAAKFIMGIVPAIALHNVLPAIRELCEEVERLEKQVKVAKEALGYYAKLESTIDDPAREALFELAAMEKECTKN